MRFRPRLRIGIFARIYLFALSLLIAALIGIVWLTNALIAPVLIAAETRLDTWLLHQVAQAGDPPQQRMLLETTRDAGREITLYDRSGAVRASGDPQRTTPLDPALTAKLRQATSARDEDGTLLVNLHEPGEWNGIGIVRHLDDVDLSIGLGPIIAVLVVLALVAWPLARSLSVPIRRLATTMLRFGQGDAAARADTRHGGEVGELGRAFNEMADQIAALLRAEKLLIAGVAHELRTPLQRIRTAIELAVDESPTGQATRQQHVESIAGDLKELERIVGDVLTLARLETASAGTASRSLLQQREWISAADLIRSCVLRFETTYAEREVRLELVEPLPEIHVEPRLLARAIGNLLENAHKYSPSHAEIALLARANGGQLCIEVRDQGIGIAPEHLEHVFKPFHRADEARSRGLGGAGLGLAIVKGVIDAHGGTVAIASVPAQGSCITLQLPIKSSRENDGAALHADNPGYD